MPFVPTRYLRRVGRKVPGLPRLYRILLARRLLRRGEAELDYPGARIRIRTTTRAVVRLRLRPSAKEPWTVEWIEQNLRDGDVLYDIGANVGVYSLIAARAGPPDVRVVAVEPGYANYASLCENVFLNGLGSQITALPLVLGERSRLGALTYADVSAGAALHTLDSDGGTGFRQSVLVYALDDLIETFGLPAPTLVKLDVDGAEAAVLAGARRTLRDPALRSLVVEIEHETTGPVVEELEASGFELARRIDDRFGRPLPGIWYGIFERRREGRPQPPGAG